MKIGDFKNIHKGQRCFIVCNGPHLNDIDPSLLDDEITIGMNRVYIEPRWKIDYLCVTANKVKAQFMGEIVEAPVKAVFMPTEEIHDAVVQVEMRKNDPRRFVYDLENEKVGKGSGVTYLAMHIACWMGCDPVYIIGCDHEWTLDNTIKRSTKLVIQTGPDLNHFHPEYFDVGIVWAYSNDMRPRFEVGFRLAAKAYAEKGRTLLNASTYTQLPASIIPRVNFHEII